MCDNNNNSTDQKQNSLHVHASQNLHLFMAISLKRFFSEKRVMLWDF